MDRQHTLAQGSGGHKLIAAGNIERASGRLGAHVRGTLAACRQSHILQRAHHDLALVVLIRVPGLTGLTGSGIRLPVYLGVFGRHIRAGDGIGDLDLLHRAFARHAHMVGLYRYLVHYGALCRSYHGTFRIHRHSAKSPFQHHIAAHGHIHGRVRLIDQTHTAPAACHDEAAYRGCARQLNGAAAADDQPVAYLRIGQAHSRIRHAVSQYKRPGHLSTGEGRTRLTGHGVALYRRVKLRGQIALHQIVHDLGKLRPGNGGRGIEPATAVPTDVPTGHHGRHRTHSPVGHCRPILERIERAGRAVAQAERPGQYGHGLLTGDGRIGIESAPIPRHHAHGHCLLHGLIVPRTGRHIRIAGQIRRFSGGKGPGNHRGHLGPAEQALGIDLSVVSVEQAVFHSVLQCRAGPVRREVGKGRSNGWLTLPGLGRHRRYHTQQQRQHQQQGQTASDVFTHCFFLLFI